MKWHVFLRFKVFDHPERSLHIASYVLRIGVSVMELECAEFLISHTFQRKHYII